MTHSIVLVRRKRAARRPVMAAVIVVLALVALAGTFVFRDRAGRDSEGHTAPVGFRTIRQTVPATVSLAFPAIGELTASASGQVDAVKTYPGDVVGRGRELFVVEGRPLIAFSAPGPFSRELRHGDSGDDVSALQAALADEGYYRVPISGVFDDVTATALETWQNLHGLPVTRVFEPRDVLTGTWPARVAEVTVTIGATVVPGGVLAVLTGVQATAGTLELINPGDAGRVRNGMRVEWPGSEALVEAGSAGTLSIRLNGGNVAEAVNQPAVVVLRERDNVLSVPVDAVIEEGGSSYVVVRSGGGKGRRVPVRTGISDGTYVEISGDLHAGDEVALSGGPQ